MDELVTYFKVMSDEMRLRIILLLSRRVLCVCELCEILRLSQPRVSQQLAKLRDLGMVQDERKGQWMLYRLTIDHPIISKVISAIEDNITQYPSLVQDLQAFAKLEADNRLCDQKIQNGGVVETI